MPRYCIHCGIELANKNWSLSNKKTSNYICKKCARQKIKIYRNSNPCKVKEQKHRYWLLHKKEIMKHRGQQRKWAKIMRKYKITKEQYEYILRSQDYRCAICGKKFTKKNPACVDHNHRTKEVRGILCRKCNTAIGFLGDDAYLTHKAFEYLTKGI